MAIKFKDVCYKDVINKVSFDIKMEKINSIVGCNGSGKTTLIQLLCMLKSPTKGKILFDNTYKIGLVSQQVEEQLFCETVEDELKSNLESFNYTKEKLDKKVKDALKMVELDLDILKRDPLKISSSEMRKISLAKALSINPQILVLDEPCIGLDMKEKETIIRILQKLKRRYSKTVIIVTNDIEFVHLVSDNIIGISNGKVLRTGNKYSFFKEVDLLKKNKIAVPKIIEFEETVLKKKNIKLGYRDDINDLIKDILRNAKK